MRSPGQWSGPIRAVALGFLCCLLVLGSSAFGADGGQGPRSVLQGVAALEKPVTYSETKIPLGGLVEKVAQDTGVALTAAKDVADEPVAVVVKDLPARELLQQLAELLDYRWSRRRQTSGVKRQAPAKASAEEKPSLTSDAWRLTPAFEIWQDLAGKQREEAMRRAGSAAAEKRLQREVERCVEIAAMSPEQIRRLVEEFERHVESSDQLLAAVGMEEYLRRMRARSPEEKERVRDSGAATLLAAPVPRALAAFLGRLTPAQWATLRRDGELAFSTDPRPGELALPADVARTFRAAPATFPGRLRTDPEPDPRQEAERLGHEKVVQEEWAAATGYRVLFRFSKERHGRRTGASLRLDAFATPIRGGTPAAAPTWSRGPIPQLYLTSVVRDEPTREAALDEPGRLAALAKDSVLGGKKVFVPDPKPRLNFLGRESSLERQLQELLPDIARTYGVQLISDAYWNAPLTYLRQFPDEEPAALFALLDRFAGSYHRWDRRGSVIRVRSRTWFLDRPNEIPLRLVRRWQEVCALHGALPLEEYASMAATLSDGQMESLESLIGEGMFPSDLRDLYAVHAARRALRLYTLLAPAQRQALWQSGTLAVARMTPRQRELFVATVKEPHRFRPVPLDLTRLDTGSFSINAQPSVRIREQREGAIRYRTERAAGSMPADAPNGTTRHPVTEIQFHCQYGPELRESVRITVAASPQAAG